MVKAIALPMLLPMALCHPALAGSVGPPAAEPLEEVIVHGRKLAELRKELHQAEDQFFSVFNSLNSDDDYDVRCGERAPVGSRIKRRVCEARFVGELSSMHAAAMMRGASAVAPAFMARMNRKERLLLDEMRRLVVAHPELQQALEEITRARIRVTTSRQQDW